MNLINNIKLKRKNKKLKKKQINYPIINFNFGNNNNKENELITSIDPINTNSTNTNKKSNKDKINLFSKNEISTTKYTRYNFIFKNLFEQFKRYTNIYFVIVSIITLIPAVSPFDPATSILPLGIILVVTAIKEGYEDFKRYKADSLSNNREYLILNKDHGDNNNNQFKSIKSKYIKVGDLIKLKNNQILPSDILLLSSSSTSSNEGICFVETSQLDGESNLKIFKSCKETHSIFQQQQQPVGEEESSIIPNLNGTIQCENPNNNLYKFKGVLNLNNNENNEDGSQTTTVISLSEKQLLLRGSKLRNTDYIYGIIVYCGKDTKLSLNQKSPPSKYSTIEKKLSKSVIGLFLFKMILVIVSTIVGTIITDKTINSSWYLWFNENPDSIGLVIVKTFFSYFAYLSFLVPMSLFITLEVVKVTQSQFMQWDYLMSYKEKEYRESLNNNNNCTTTTSKNQVNQDDDDEYNSQILNKYMTVKNSNLNDELALVKYIFSDKTGTLTENKMIFSKCSINGKIYSNANSGELLNEIKQKESIDELVEDGNETIDQKLIKQFLINMSCCHSAVSELDEDGFQIYQSPSPDEISLLNCSKLNQFTFKDRNSNSDDGGGDNIILTILKKEKSFKLLTTMEFTSERRRMSVILKDKETNKIYLYSKGADSIMIPRLSKQQQQQQDHDQLLTKTENDLKEFSIQGLRTLILTIKEINENEFNQWFERYNNALNNIENRDELIDRLNDEMEQDLTLIGCTAIEDKLQDGVGESIEKLLASNIKIWIITGDKQETAINIGYSCKLLSPPSDQSNHQLIIINSKSIQECEQQLNSIVIDSTIKNTIVIDGESLIFIFLSNELSNKFLEISKNVHSVICNRVTPIQKSLIVRLVKKGTGEICLAIGDGANDVSMIQEAHIGVGIFGNEGSQASRASDYSLLRFRHLTRLITVHGRYSLIRNVACVRFSFFKNVAFFFIGFLFSIHSGWSSSTLFSDAMITTFNTVITAVPPYFMALFEKDVSEEILENNPKLFLEVQSGKHFNYISIAKSILIGLYQACVIYFGTYLLFYNDNILNQNGKIGGLAMMGSYTVTYSMITVLLQAAIDLNYWNFIVHIGIWGSICLYIIIAFITNAWQSAMPASYLVWDYSLSLLQFYLMVIIMIFIALLPSFTFKYLKQQFFSLDSFKIKEFEKLINNKNKKSSTTTTTSLQPSSSQSDNGSGSNSSGVV